MDRLGCFQKKRSFARTGEFSLLLQLIGCAEKRYAVHSLPAPGLIRVMFVCALYCLQFIGLYFACNVPSLDHRKHTLVTTST